MIDPCSISQFYSANAFKGKKRKVSDNRAHQLAVYCCNFAAGISQRNLSGLTRRLASGIVHGDYRALINGGAPVLKRRLIRTQRTHRRLATILLMPLLAQQRVLPIDRR